MIETLIRVTLPWPDSALSPNARSRYEKIRAVKCARHTAHTFTLKERPHGSEPTPHPGPLVAVMRFYPPSKSWYDTDGLISRCKAYQDGIFDALELDDHLIVANVARRCEVIPDGMVVIEICKDAPEFLFSKGEEP